ncbi:MAG: type II toxin-antitoxin system RelE/ParE family toxin [Dethiobacter sp.]|jgi:addiction module RelE/StbE family toxin|nr:MAG: type II toxin-antitoxin system RelE/ParE family toxin [Dethiobacter sp.]
MERKNKIQYLELALSDLQDIVSYISQQLAAPQAALDLANKLDKAISNLEHFPFSGKSYSSDKRLKDEYRMLVVESYLVFYVVKNHTVEIRRIIYGKRKYDRLL